MQPARKKLSHQEIVAHLSEQQSGKQAEARGNSRLHVAAWLCLEY